MMITACVYLFCGLIRAEAAESWLPTQPIAKDQVRLLACRYEGSTLARTSPMGTGGWTCEKRMSGDATETTFHLTSEVARSAGVAIAFDFADWSPENYLLVPGAIYNGNRFHVLKGGYMPPYPREMFFNPRLPLTMSDNPRLSLERGVASKIELLTGSAATPAVCFYSPKQRRGFILLFEQRTRWGENGLVIEENAAQNRITFAVCAPGIREQAAGFGDFRPSGDRGTDIKAGDSIILRFKTYSFRAKGIPDLLDKFLAVRKALTGPNQPRNLVPMSTLRDTIASRFKSRWTTVPAGSYYLPENDRNFQLGWVSGFMQTPMLALGDPVERDHIGKQLDFVTKTLQAPSGFFQSGIAAEGKLRFDRTLDSRGFVLTRKNSDALSMYLKFFQIYEAQGHGNLIKPEWKKAARRLADAFVMVWRRYGEFGQYLDPVTGEIAVFNSTGGAIAPGGLALAAAYFKNPEYLEVAKAAAEFYYKRDVAGRGLTAGHCGDTSQDPDSESAFGFLESLMTLYWATGSPEWLDRARTEAALCATWTLSYDFEFPPQSQIAQLGGHMAGAVWASTQNKHATPGICTSSGDALFKLFRATGDRRYADLIRDIQHAHTEATEMPGHRTCGSGPGGSMERIQTGDAEGKGAIGNYIQTQNGWTELSGLMMATELPGIYLRTDTGALYVFDHIEAKVVERGRSKVVLELTNRTNYDASVSIFAEQAREAIKPLAYTAYLRWPKVRIPTKSTVRITIDRQ